MLEIGRQMSKHLADDHLGNQVEILTDDSKRALVVALLQQHGLRTFIETGSYQGDMIAAVLPYVDEVRSVELDVHNFDCCQQRFAQEPKVKLYFGNSAARLPGMLDGVGSSLIWLDAHKSGPDSSGSHEENPLRFELKTIFSEHTKHVVLIDDARFLGRGSWPTYEEILGMTDGAALLEDDIIRIVR
jgi:hypothetical protein